MSLDGFRTLITLLLSVDNHQTEWLPLVGLKSGASEIAYVLLQKPFQPHIQRLPVQHNSYEYRVLVSDEFPFPMGNALWHLQTST